MATAEFKITLFHPIQKILIRTKIYLVVLKEIRRFAAR